MTINIVVEQRQLSGSSQDDDLQRVAIVYSGVDEYRVSHPPRQWEMLLSG